MQAPQSFGISTWISAGSAILVIISFLFNSWHSFQSTASDETKLEVQVANMQKSIDGMRHDDGQQIGDMKVSVGILGAKIDMLISEKQATRVSSVDKQ